MLQYVIYVQLILSQSYGGRKPRDSSEAKFSMGCECGRRQKDPEVERHCQATAKIDGGMLFIIGKLTLGSLWVTVGHFG